VKRARVNFCSSECAVRVSVPIQSIWRRIAERLRWAASTLVRRIAIAAVVLSGYVACSAAPGQGTVLTNSYLLGQPTNSPLFTIADGNPDRKIVDAEIESVRHRYANGGNICAKVHTACQLKGDAARRLFPGYRFYLICWNEDTVDKQKPGVGLAVGLYYALALGPAGDTWRFQGGGNFEEFGKFLAARKVDLKTMSDAKLIWEAFCEIHRQGWTSHPSTQFSETEWRLGNEQAHEYDRFYHCFYRVRTTTNGVCQSARFESIPVKQ